jgi:hypothetical protein
MNRETGNWKLEKEAFELAAEFPVSSFQFRFSMTQWPDDLMTRSQVNDEHLDSRH